MLVIFLELILQLEWIRRLPQKSHKKLFLLLGSHFYIVFRKNIKTIKLDTVILSYLNVLYKFFKYYKKCFSNYLQMGI